MGILAGEVILFGNLDIAGTPEVYYILVISLPPQRLDPTLNIPISSLNFFARFYPIRSDVTHC